MSFSIQSCTGQGGGSSRPAAGVFLSCANPYPETIFHVALPICFVGRVSFVFPRKVLIAAGGGFPGAAFGLSNQLRDFLPAWFIRVASRPDPSFRLSSAQLSFGLGLYAWISYYVCAFLPYRMLVDEYQDASRRVMQVGFRCFTSAMYNCKCRVFCLVCFVLRTGGYRVFCSRLFYELSGRAEHDRGSTTAMWTAFGCCVTAALRKW